jgi:hypothetical protein
MKNQLIPFLINIFWFFLEYNFLHETNDLNLITLYQSVEKNPHKLIKITPITKEEFNSFRIYFLIQVLTLLLSIME